MKTPSKKFGKKRTQLARWILYAVLGPVLRDLGHGAAVLSERNDFYQRRAIERLKSLRVFLADNAGLPAVPIGGFDEYEAHWKEARSVEA